MPEILECLVLWPALTVEVSHQGRSTEELTAGPVQAVQLCELVIDVEGSVPFAGRDQGR